MVERAPQLIDVGGGEALREIHRRIEDGDLRGSFAITQQTIDEEAAKYIGKYAGVSGDAAVRALAAGADGGVPAPKKYNADPVYYRNDELADGVKKYGGKLRKPAPNPKVEQA